jgi:hypothetical protein
MTELTLTKHHALGNDFLVVFHPHVADLIGAGALVQMACSLPRASPATRRGCGCTTPTARAPR